jgi:hypothetical protein
LSVPNEKVFITLALGEKIIRQQQKRFKNKITKH